MRTLLLALLTVLPLTAGSGVALGEEVSRPYTLDHSQVRDMTSRAGDLYRIYVSWPDAPAPESGFPVLYVLDGGDNFAIVAETARRLARFAPRSGVMPGIVVGVGYPADDLRRRAYDYTPATDMETDPMGNAVGGADRFLAFLTQDLRPAIDASFSTDPSRQALFGHSYAGLFVLHALFTRPESFQTYIAASPSVWFGDGQILTEARSFAEARPASRPSLILTVGEGEQREASPDKTADKARRLGAADLAEVLAPLRGRGVDLHFTIFNEAVHGTSALPAIGLAVPRAFAAEAN